MKALVAGECFSPNLGDPILCNGMAYLLSSVVPSMEISFLDISGRKGCPVWDPYRHLGQFQHPLLNKISSNIKWQLSKSVLKNLFLKSIRETDIVVVAGGQLLMDNALSFPRKIKLLIETAEEIGVPITFYACGAYDNWSSLGKTMLRDSLCSKTVKYIGCRDFNSQAIVKALSGREVYLNHDPAFPYIIENSKPHASLYQRGLIVMDPVKFVKNRSCSTEDVDSWYTTLIKTAGNDDLILSNGEIGDRKYIDYLRKSLIVDCTNWQRDLRGPDELIALLSKCDSIITPRLHAAIVGWAFGKKVAVIQGDPKISSVMEFSGISGGMLQINGVGANLSIDSIPNGAWSQLDAIQKSNIVNYSVKSVKSMLNIAGF